jgi:glutamine---fructose-6-phosphate transaminase (isomerizing)
MTANASLMARETAEAPDAVARLLDREAQSFADLGTRLRRLSPPVVATCARGSSDHAAGFLKYAIEIALGIPVASIGPSIATIYDAPLKLAGTVLVTISQSGQSPDLVALQARARTSGALTLALVNVTESPVAAGADIVVPLHAGEEHSVAATKSFVAATAAALALVAAWSGDTQMSAALTELPAALARALACDWSAASAPFAAAASLYAVGRGPSFYIAQEAALKCKETAALHAEAFSSAEVMHGPLRLVEQRFPVLAFVPDDAAADATRTGLQRMAANGARIFAATARPDLPGTRLPTVATRHGMTDAIAAILAFYRFIEAVSRQRGFDPDRPAHLSKITETF